MDPTTLVTFLFRAPTQARVVELLGSWDNFAQPYRMHHDRKRGQGSWTGCFKFQNIICDGSEQPGTKPRNGGLKQGGTYWYYYRLNDETEAYDDREPHTSNCPLLPGQVMNILEVPQELVERPSSRRTLSLDVGGELARLDSTHTLEPSDKFAALEPPPRSKVHGRCVSDLALSGRLENITQDDAGTPISPHTPSSGESEARPRSPGADEAGESYTGRMRVPSPRSPRSLRPSSVSSTGSSVYSCTVDAEPVPYLPTEDTRLPSWPAPMKFTFPASLPTDYSSDHDLPHTRQLRECHSFTDRVTYHPDPHDELEPIAGLPAIMEHPRPSTSSGPTSWSDIPWSRNGTCYPPEMDDTLPEEYQHPARIHTDHNNPLEDQDDSDHLHSTEQDQSYEICSPTFSADTISSNGGGVNTPFRLSFGSPLAGPFYSSQDDGLQQTVSHPIYDSTDHEASLETLTQHLLNKYPPGDSSKGDDQAPAYSYGPPSRAPPPPPPARAAPPPPPPLESSTLATLSTYSLPTTESPPTSSKLSATTMTSNTVVPKPTTAAQQSPHGLGIEAATNRGVESSFADTVFSELDFLRGAIS